MTTVDPNYLLHDQRLKHAKWHFVSKQARVCNDQIRSPLLLFSVASIPLIDCQLVGRGKGNFAPISNFVLRVGKAGITRKNKKRKKHGILFDEGRREKASVAVALYFLFSYSFT
jgi:hypothetical protein